MRHIHMILLAALACLVLTGCQKQLYGNLSEKEANDVLAALLEAGIPSEKREGEESTYAVWVEETEFARAVRILDDRALPGKRYDDLGTVFGKNAMFSTPMEEKARYLYAMQEELSRTISEISGVLVARVHLVLPEQDQLGREISKPSAAVFVKHVDDERHDPEVHLRQIRELVAASIPQLDKNDIVVTFFPVAIKDSPAFTPNWRTVFGIRVAEESAPVLWWAAGIAPTVCLLLLAATLFSYLRRRKQ